MLLQLDPQLLTMHQLSLSFPQCMPTNMESMTDILVLFLAKRKTVIIMLLLDHTVLTFPTVVSKLLLTQ